MKKLFLAVAAIAAVFSVTNVDARSKECKQAKQKNNIAAHEYYQNGEIQEVRHDMLLTGNLWTIKNRNNKQIWKAVNDQKQDVVVKLKGNDYKEFAKVKIDGEKVFVKDVNPDGRLKHVAKILEDGNRYVDKVVYHTDGTEIVSVR